MGFQVNPIICQAPNTAEMCGSLVPTTVQEVASHRRELWDVALNLSRE